MVVWGGNRIFSGLVAIAPFGGLALLWGRDANYTLKYYLPLRPKNTSLFNGILTTVFSPLKCRKCECVSGVEIIKPESVPR